MPVSPVRITPRCWRCWTARWPWPAAAYELAGDGSGSAEVALSVADDMHGRGIGTLLLEHLVSLARGRGVRMPSSRRR